MKIKGYKIIELRGALLGQPASVLVTTTDSFLMAVKCFRIYQKLNPNINIRIEAILDNNSKEDVLHEMDSTAG